jgi:MFS family permease
MPWQSVFLVFAGIIIASLLLLPLLRSPAPASRAELQESLSQTLGKAFRDPSYTLIFVGFFSCGYQLGFITAHFPAFITEVCGPIDPDRCSMVSDHHDLGAGRMAIALIGLTNIAGTILAGWLGTAFQRKYLLAGSTSAGHWPRRPSSSCR